MAAYQERIERLEQLIKLIPSANKGGDFPSGSHLLERLHTYYSGHAPKSRMRTIQRDLQDLIDEDRIEVVNTATKPFRYRRKTDAEDDGPGVQEYIREVVQTELGDSLSKLRLERIWPKLMKDQDRTVLKENKLRVISDTLRLTPADIRPGVLSAVLEALSSSLTLKISYRDAKGKNSQPLLHPQGLLQRGPRVYLYALKEGEPQTVRMYVLHRMIRAEVGTAAALQAAGFDLQRYIDAGHADFSGGQMLNLKMRARGYVADLLRDCPFNDSQRIDEEPESSPFDVVVRATLPATGQLLRWLLGCGDNVQVVEPVDLRQVMAVQAAKMASLYALPNDVDINAGLGAGSSSRPYVVSEDDVLQSN